MLSPPLPMLLLRHTSSQVAAAPIATGVVQQMARISTTECCCPSLAPSFEPADGGVGRCGEVHHKRLSMADSNNACISALHISCATSMQLIPARSPAVGSEPHSIRKETICN